MRFVAVFHKLSIRIGLWSDMAINSDLTVVVGTSPAFWPHLKMSLQTIPSHIPVIVSWYGDEMPPDLPAHVTVVRPRRRFDNYHRGYVLNVGIRAVQTEFVLLSDADTLYPRDFFTALPLNAMTILRFYCGRLTREATSCVEAGRHWEDVYCDYDDAHDWMYLVIRGFHNPCVYPLWLLEALRGYDEAMLGWGGEDDDLTYRSLRCGVRQVRLPRLTADLWHAGSADFPTTYNRGNTSARNMAILHDATRFAAANPLAWGDST